ncbi:MAG: hypothetical protein P4L74_05070 [Candidatus Doudnabacteria bacterium]|nr:hypothetical protein [Candidatus Doudnabacteria bacterium]
MGFKFFGPEEQNMHNEIKENAKPSFASAARLFFEEYAAEPGIWQSTKRESKAKALLQQLRDVGNPDEELLGYEFCKLAFEDTLEKFDLSCAEAVPSGRDPKNLDLVTINSESYMVKKITDLDVPPELAKAAEMVEHGLPGTLALFAKNEGILRPQPLAIKALETNAQREELLLAFFGKEYFAIGNM